MMRRESLGGPEGIAFLVFGDPAPKGSMKLVGPWRLVPDDDKGLQAWVRAVKGSALVATAGLVRPVFVKRPLAIEITFVLPRPASRAKARWAHFARGDGDKLERATWDALQGMLYENDSRLVEWRGRKTYDGSAFGLRGTGAVVDIWPLDAAKGA
jgi:crossover junction endodeoxyribonuclease RusA